MTTQNHVKYSITLDEQYVSELIDNFINGNYIDAIDMFTRLDVYDRRTMIEQVSELVDEKQYLHIVTYLAVNFKRV